MLSSAIIYVVISVLQEQEGIYEGDYFMNFDIVVCTLIMFLWLIKFYVSQNKKQYLKKI